MFLFHPIFLPGGPDSLGPPTLLWKAPSRPSRLRTLPAGHQRPRRRSDALPQALAPSGPKAGGRRGPGAGRTGVTAGPTRRGPRRAAHHLLRRRGRDLLREFGRPREREEAAQQDPQRGHQQRHGRQVLRGRAHAPSPAGPKPAPASAPLPPARGWRTREGFLPSSSRRAATLFCPRTGMGAGKWGPVGPMDLAFCLKPACS